MLLRGYSDSVEFKIDTCGIDCRARQAGRGDRGMEVPSSLESAARFHDVSPPWN
jgi:hypothetical protein